MNINQRGFATEKINVPELDRLDKLALHKREPYTEIIKRLLDFWDENHGNTK